jgi:hypothetical protein
VRSGRRKSIIAGSVNSREPPKRPGIPESMSGNRYSRHPRQARHRTAPGERPDGEAVRAYRNQTGVGLVEAGQAVDRIAAQPEIPHGSLLIRSKNDSFLS